MPMLIYPQKFNKSTAAVTVAPNERCCNVTCTRNMEQKLKKNIDSRHTARLYCLATFELHISPTKIAYFKFCEIMNCSGSIAPPTTIICCTAVADTFFIKNCMLKQQQQPQQNRKRKSSRQILFIWEEFCTSDFGIAHQSDKIK